MGKQGRSVSDREPPKQSYGDLASWSGEVRGYENFLEYSRAVQKLVRALENTQEARGEYEQVAHDIDPPELLEEALATNTESLLHGLQEMDAAYAYIANEGRVVAETKKGANWIPPIPPGVLAHLAALATPGDETFRNQAAQNKMKHQQFEVQRAAGAEPCLHGNTCKTRRVTWPGRSQGPACWRHITEDEKFELSALYDQAVQTLSCRACHAAIGEPCLQEALTTRVDGYYSPIRSFNKRKVHKVRLDDYACTL